MFYEQKYSESSDRQLTRREPSRRLLTRDKRTRTREIEKNFGSVRMFVVVLPRCSSTEKIHERSTQTVVFLKKTFSNFLPTRLSFVRNHKPKRQMKANWKQFQLSRLDRILFFDRAKSCFFLSLSSDCMLCVIVVCSQCRKKIAEREREREFCRKLQFPVTKKKTRAITSSTKSNKFYSTKLSERS